MSSIWFCHVTLCMSSISFSFSPYDIFLSMTGLSPFFNFLNSSTFKFINFKNERFSLFNASFYAITPIIYIFQFHKILKGQERERINVNKSMKLALVLGAYDLNLSTTLTKLDIVVLQLHLRFLKSMLREDIKPLYVLFVFIYIFGKYIIIVSD